MRVVVQLLGRWPMYGLAGESSAALSQTQKIAGKSGEYYMYLAWDNCTYECRLLFILQSFLCSRHLGVQEVKSH